MIRNIASSLLCFLSALLQSRAQDAGNVIPFQGQLANQVGQPLSPATPVTLVFRFYQAPVGGTAIWEESQPNISVSSGRFSVGVAGGGSQSYISDLNRGFLTGNTGGNETRPKNVYVQDLIKL